MPHEDTGNGLVAKSPQPWGRGAGGGGHAIDPFNFNFFFPLQIFADVDGGVGGLLRLARAINGPTHT